ncbi:caspase-10-like isoform X2 [Pecten maximus]|nr:caspase-10-like isoform X2 [Pecten maximus]
MDSKKAERRTRLESIGDELSLDNICILKFLSHGVVPARKLQECTKGSTLLLEIGAEGNDVHLVEGLARAGRKDLASRYSEGCQNEGEALYSQMMKNFDDLEKTCLNEFRVLLVYIANELTDSEDLQKLKDVTTGVPKRALAKAATVLDFFNLLMEEKNLLPQTLDTALLNPMDRLRVTTWKKHSEQISGFKERIALRESGEREGSRVKPTAETIPKVAESKQTSGDRKECLEEAQETEPKLAENEQTGERTEETATKVNAVEAKQTDELAERSEKAQETVSKVTETEHTREKTRENIQEAGGQGVERTEHPEISGENEERPDVSQENVTETEHSNTGGQKQENQDQDPEKRQDGATSEQPHIEDGRRNTLNPDTDSGAKPKRHPVNRRMKNIRLKEYRMTCKPRGKAVIFNIEKFSSLYSHPTDQKPRDRIGSSVDADGIQRIFKQLHFDVERFDDCLLHMLKDRLWKLAYETDHDHFDCIAIFILTHGSNGQLLDANCKSFDFEPLRKYFYASNCKTLAGKPKMFFIQACQGSVTQGRYNHLEKDTIVVEPTTLSSTPSSTPSSSPPSTPSSSPPSTPISFAESQGNQSPDEADFLLCHSTSPGYVSYRHTEKGSWFISTFIETLERDCNRVDLLEILTRANCILGGKTGTVKGKPCAQIANIITSLRGKVFLRTIPDT